MELLQILVLKEYHIPKTEKRSLYNSKHHHKHVLTLLSVARENEEKITYLWLAESRPITAVQINTRAFAIFSVI